MVGRWGTILVVHVIVVVVVVVESASASACTTRSSNTGMFMLSSWRRASTILETLRPKMGGRAVERYLAVSSSVERNGGGKNGLVRKGGREGGRENHRISQSQPTDHTKQPLAARTTRIHTPRCIKAKSPGVHIRAPSIPAHAAARYFILAYPLGDVWVEELHGGN